MAVIHTNLTCDLQKAVKVFYLDGNLFSQDNQANQFHVTVLDGGSAATISGTVTADVIRSDGGTVTVTGSLSGNVANVTFPAAVYAIPGVVSIVVKLTTSGVITTIAAVVANIYQSSTNTPIDPGTIIPSVTTLITAIETAVASIPADYSSLWTSLAPAFSSSTSYTEGQYVTYNGGLYRFKTAHNGSWAAGDVSAVNIGGELQGLKSAINNISVFTFGDAVQKKFINSSGVVDNNNSYAYKFIPYTGGAIEINGTTNSGIINYFNSSDSFISGTGWKNLTNYYIKAADIPTGTAKIAISFTLADIGTIVAYENKLSKIKEIDEKADYANNRIDKASIFTVEDAVRGYYINTTGGISSSNSYAYKYIPYIGGNIEVTGTTGSGIINYYNSSDTLLQSSGWISLTNRIIKEADVPNNTAKISFSFAVADINTTVVYQNKLSKIAEIDELKSEIAVFDKVTEDAEVPVLRDGSIGNSSNANAVTSDKITRINKKYSYLVIQFIGDLSVANQYGFSYCMFHGATDGMTTSAAYSASGVSKVAVNTDFNTAPLYTEPYLMIPMNEFIGYEHISVCCFRKNNGSFVPIRIATEQNSIRVMYGYNFSVTSKRELDNFDVSHKLDNARHIKNNAGTPLTILHFSDLHADSSAMNRIISDAESMGTQIDQMICTGDIVNNTAAQISSWWNEDVLTCIGNHDSASYNAETGYNWTALSMANRDAYYIAPFESNWGITHISGKSYYYKDYTTQKVRLIVMDVMLYNDNGTDATDQTTWLSGLLASAITNNLHVLIAIHAPHGGATAKDCSFSRYGQTAMPTNSDCNTPQTVIDTVAAAITNGLKFIGYLVGHTHQDNIWDAENNGKQLMYCVTCANVNQNAQWRNSDQNRSTSEDAYNLVTIDTVNTLVKIVRGGGADIDDRMRTREAICFDYSTGTKVGEVL